MAQVEDVDEKLKAKDQMAWVGRMNNIRQQADEIILACVRQVKSDAKGHLKS